MTDMQQRTKDFLNDEWSTYVQRFKALTPETAAEAVRAQGYPSLHALLSHVIHWWEEALPIIGAIAAGREVEARKYDFDVFNAEGVAIYKDWSESDLLAHFEEMRLKFLAAVSALPEAAREHRRVRSWSYGVVVEHAKEHAFNISRLVALDTLQHEWAEYVSEFNRRPAERQAAFLEKQGYARFRDVLAHIIAWWQVALGNIENMRADPAFSEPGQDVETFNAEAVRRFESLPETEVLAQFESTRQAFEKLVAGLPDGSLNDSRINKQLYWDLIEHYFEHK